MVACSMLRGQWSDTALTVLHRCLADVLPGRHSSRITNYAEARVVVYSGCQALVRGHRRRPATARA